MTELRIEVLDDSDALAREVAGALVERLQQAQSEGNAPHIALTGGTIADAIHARVGEIGSDSEVDWSRVHFWWGDERYVDSDDGDRNALAARREMLDRLPVPPENIHEMPALDSGLSLEDAAAAYEQEMRASGGRTFELVMLGLGPDGHVASLMPHQAPLDVDDALTVAVADSPKPPPQRISLTFGPLNNARTIWFVVSGAGKADAVAAALADTGDLHDTPARGITGEAGTEIVWFVDRPAAAKI